MVVPLGEPYSDHPRVRPSGRTRVEEVLLVVEGMVGGFLLDLYAKKEKEGVGVL